MATTRYRRLKLAISALSAASVIAGAAYFQATQAGTTDPALASVAAPSTAITTTYQSGSTPATTSGTTAGPTAVTSSVTNARTSRGS